MEIKLVISQRIEQHSEIVLSQSLQQELAHAINDLRDKLDRNERAMYRRVIEEILMYHCPAQLREAIGAICLDDRFRDVALKSTLELSNARYPQIHRVATEYLFEATRGEVRTQGDAEFKDQNLGKAIFMDAFLRPNKLSDEIRMLEDFRKSNPREFVSSEGSRHIGEYRAALAVAQEHQTTAAVLHGMLRELLDIKSPDGQRILPAFFLEAFVLNKFTLILPQRIARRFVKRFAKIKDGHTIWNQRMRDSLLNTIGEFVLVCMGIISPNLFLLQKGKVDEDLIETLTEEGFDARAYLERLSLTSSGTFFWNRWHTLGRQPSIITDDLIREFITCTVRADAKAIFETVHFEDLFAKLKAVSQDDDFDQEDKDTACVEIMVSMLTDQTLIDLLLQRLKSSWMSRLEIFYPKAA